MEVDSPGQSQDWRWANLAGEEGSEMCSTTLADGPLSCVRPEGHSGGHEFHAESGSWIDDVHGEGGHG